MGTIAAIRHDVARAAIAALLALAGCSSAQDVLAPSAITPPPLAPSAITPPPVSRPPVDPSADAPAAPQPAQVASNAAVADARVQFAPIVGTSVEAANALSAGLSSRARMRGIRLTGAAVPPTHLLKGYFTPLVEGGQTTVIFVWDVYDPAGNRVHRISGQQKSAGGGEGWSAVPPASMRAIAEATIDQLAEWLASRAG